MLPELGTGRSPISCQFSLELGVVAYSPRLYGQLHDRGKKVHPLSRSGATEPGRRRRGRGVNPVRRRRLGSREPKFGRRRRSGNGQPHPPTARRAGRSAGTRSQWWRLGKIPRSQVCDSCGRVPPRPRRSPPGRSVTVRRADPATVSRGGVGLAFGLGTGRDARRGRADPAVPRPPHS
jgi:hypothetical protein